jgi:hypothetical protein
LRATGVDGFPSFDRKESKVSGRDSLFLDMLERRLRDLYGKADGMNHVRGVLMLVAAAIAFWRGWKIHTGNYAWTAYGLGVLAVGLAVWHLTRKAEARRG